MLLVVIDFVHHRLTAADVVRRVFHVVGAREATRQVEAGDVDADAVAGLEQIAGGENFDPVFLDLTRCDGLLRSARERVPGPPRL